LILLCRTAIFAVLERNSRVGLCHDQPMTPPEKTKADTKEEGASNVAKRVQQGINLTLAGLLHDTLGQTDKLQTALTEAAQKHLNLGDAQAAGHLAEVWHAGTFNLDAARKGLGGLLEAKLSTPNDPVADLQVLSHGQVVAKAQLKYLRRPAATTKAISEPRYDTVQKVVPSDQVASVRRVAAARGEDGLGNRNFPDTAKRVKGQLEHNGVRSEPLSKAEAEKLVGDQASAVKNLRGRGVAGQVAQAALVSAAIGVTTSALGNLGKHHRGEVTGRQMLLEAGQAGAVSAATAAATMGLTVALRRVASANVVGAMAGTMVEIGKDGKALAFGEIDLSVFGERAAKHAVGGAGALAGAEAGALIGTLIFPGVGTIVGGMIGGSLGSLASTKSLELGITGVKHVLSRGTVASSEPAMQLPLLVT
jgi:hypothetical protein